MWICIDMQKKSGYCTDLFWIYGWLKNPAIWLAVKNSVKINDKSSQYIQKTLFLTHFWSILPIFGAKTFFPENPALSSTTSYGFLAPYQNLEKNNDNIPRKQMEGWKDGQTLFYRTLPATAGGPIRIKRFYLPQIAEKISDKNFTKFWNPFQSLYDSSVTEVMILFQMERNCQFSSKNLEKRST